MSPLIDIAEKEFTSKEERTRVINDLHALRQHPGWLVLDIILGKYVEQLGATILESESLEQEQEKIMKLQRMDCIVFKDLPLDLIKELHPTNAVSIVPQDDPYYTAEEIEAQRNAQKLGIDNEPQE